MKSRSKRSLIPHRKYLALQWEIAIGKACKMQNHRQCRRKKSWYLKLGIAPCAVSNSRYEQNTAGSVGNVLHCMTTIVHG